MQFCSRKWHSQNLPSRCIKLSPVQWFRSLRRTRGWYIILSGLSTILLHAERKHFWPCETHSGFVFWDL